MKSTITEGMRRLALVAGVLGAAFGLLMSAAYPQTIRRHQIAHTQFQQAANTKDVKIEVEQLNAGELSVHLNCHPATTMPTRPCLT